MDFELCAEVSDRDCLNRQLRLTLGLIESCSHPETFLDDRTLGLRDWRASRDDRRGFRRRNVAILA